MLVQLSVASVSVSEDDVATWLVDITIDGVVVETNHPLSNPIQKDDQRLIRWYFDRFRQYEPYEIQKANRATSKLALCGSDLMKQLRLGELVSASRQDDDTQPYEIQIFIQHCPHGGSSVPSISQVCWELLEAPELWPAQAKVTVSRSVSKAAYSLDEQPASLHSGTDSTDLLLVVSRDLSINPSGDSDINPSVIYDILRDIQSRMSRISPHAKLCIQVVRPATINSLERILENRSQTQNKKPFDIIHFDLHGLVSGRKQQRAIASKMGYLLFNTPEGDDIKSVPIAQVAELTGKYEIKTVVLNACHSANSLYGHQANMASVFIDTGAANRVLAMAATASESATSKLFSSFYSEFLLKRKPFDACGSAARASLRQNPTRNARFHSTVAVQDWTIPVVYCKSNSVVAMLPTTPKTAGTITIASDTSTSSPNVLPLQPDQSNIEQIYGREFDAMRLEKMVFDKGTVCVYGARGMGKTCFLRNLAHHWVESGVVAKAVYMDKKLNKLQSHANIWRSIGDELGLDSCQDVQATLNIIAKSRLAIILDNLFTIDIVDRQDVIASQSPQTLGSSLLESWIEACRYVDPNLRSYLIFTSDIISVLDDVSEWNQDCAIYRLQGILRPDALSIVELATPGNPNSTNENNDDKQQKNGYLSRLWEAEPLIDLFQGNPACIKYFCRLATVSDLSLSQLYDILHGKNVVALLNIDYLRQQFPTFRHLLQLIPSLIHEVFAVWVNLSWYWHSGPIEATFIHQIVDSKLTVDEEHAECAIKLMEKMGFCGRNPDGEIHWIDPLWTIAVRVAACSFPCPEPPTTTYADDTYSSSISHLETMLQLFILDNNKHNSSNDKYSGLIKSIRLLKTAITPAFQYISTSDYINFLTDYFMQQNYKCKPICDRIAAGTLNLESSTDEVANLKENYFFVVKVWSNQQSSQYIILPVLWPSLVIFDFALVVLQLYSASQVELIGIYYEQLLQSTLDYSHFRYGGRPFREPCLIFLLQVLKWLIEAHGRYIPSLEPRFGEFVSKGNQHIEASEREYGNTETDDLGKCKAEFYFSTSIAFSSHGNSEQSTEASTKGIETLVRLAKINGESERLAEFLSPDSPFQKVWKIIAGHRPSEEDNDKTSTISGISNQIYSHLKSIIHSQGLQRLAPQLLNLQEAAADRGNWWLSMIYMAQRQTQQLREFKLEDALETLTMREQMAHQHATPNQKGLHLFSENREVTSIFTTMMGTTDISEQERCISRLETCLQNHDLGNEYRRESRSIILEHCKVFRRQIQLVRDSKLAQHTAPTIWTAIAMDPAGISKALFDEYNDANETIESMKALLQIHQRTVELHEAEDADNIDVIDKGLDELETLSRNEPYKTLISADGVVERREWNVVRLMNSLLDQLMDNPEIDTRRVDTAKIQKILQETRKIQILNRFGDHETPEDSPQEDPVDRVERLAQELLLMRLVDVTDLIYDGGSEQEYLALFGDILNLRDTTAVFDKIINFDGELRWMDAYQSFHEWCNEHNAWQFALNDLKMAEMLQLRYLCHGFVCPIFFVEALKERDFDAAKATIQDFETAVENITNEQHVQFIYNLEPKGEMMKSGLQVVLETSTSPESRAKAADFVIEAFADVIAA